jgi:tRNA threonylcarbamoyladenosine biosynthesis protein TsaE
MKKVYFTTHANQTKKLGKIVAKKVLKIKRKKKAQVLGLEGDLGGGKTTFLKGFAKGLGIKQKILSPTFVIMRKFKIRVDSCSNSCRFVYFYHIDCYRIKNPKEILNLGFKEIISNPKNIVAVEWADRISKIMPKNTIWIIFEFAYKNKRKIKIKFK